MGNEELSVVLHELDLLIHQEIDNELSQFELSVEQSRIINYIFDVYSDAFFLFCGNRCECFKLFNSESVLIEPQGLESIRSSTTKKKNGGLLIDIHSLLILNNSR
ncbi:hypothetical protein IGI37_000526 [Enterococcus sp. AZ194]|uniref:hypothetical protein n=1 Tax=Enterococcus sp. AZ194 TaxID=2774629 RepID=UPI003F1F7300